MAKRPPDNDRREEPPDPMAGLSQQQRIEKLRERIADLTDGKMTFWDGETSAASGEAGADTEPDVTEAFLENVMAIEEAGRTVPADLLEEGGLELTPPGELDDEALAEKLREVIHAMALRYMYVKRTNHLSDRELYIEIVEELREESFMGPVGGFNFVIDLLSSGSEEDVNLSFKYYDHDEDSRRRWLESFPDYDMPAKEKPPYDRDRFLPQPDWTSPDWDDEDDPFM